jgi:hypothetical protein
MKDAKDWVHPDFKRIGEVCGMLPHETILGGVLRVVRERDALKVAGREIIEAARRSMPRKHGTIERNAKLFIPENVKSPDAGATE